MCDGEEGESLGRLPLSGWGYSDSRARFQLFEAIPMDRRRSLARSTVYPHRVLDSSVTSR